jgi:hypothetical protein
MKFTMRVLFNTDTPQLMQFQTHTIIKKYFKNIEAIKFYKHVLNFSVAEEYCWVITQVGGGGGQACCS